MLFHSWRISFVCICVYTQKICENFPHKLVKMCLGIENCFYRKMNQNIFPSNFAYHFQAKQIYRSRRGYGNLKCISIVRFPPAAQELCIHTTKWMSDKMFEYKSLFSKTSEPFSLKYFWNLRCIYHHRPSVSPSCLLLWQDIEAFCGMMISTASYFK